MYIEKVLNNNAFISLDENGEEITVNDGNTFIQIYPKT